MTLRNARRKLGVGLLLAVAAVLVWLAGLACQPGQPVEFENATSQPVAVYQGGILAFSLEPHEAKQPVGFFPEDWQPEIKAVAEDGRVLLEDKITWDEVAQMKYRIVITAPIHPPTTVPPLTDAPATPWATPPPAACWGQAPQSPLAPSPPTNLRAELVSSSLALEGQLVRLEWDNNATNDLCYVIEKKVTTEDWSIYEAAGGAPPSGTGAVSTYIVPLELGVHCYRMYLGNEEGRSAYSNEACVGVEALPRIATPTPGRRACGRTRGTEPAFQPHCLALVPGRRVRSLRSLHH